MFLIYRVVSYAVEILKILILLRIILSWIAPRSRNEFIDLIYTVTEPILRPFRILIPLGGARLDLSPILAYYVLGLAKYLIFRILSMIS
ncbi:MULTISPECIES: YggT family protein [Psychrilyobacter]|uniref:YggT family protein n=1 Tax=Psychrilyobacter piezotolerans TaxID=2293438 RepID=A0ABX9KKC2_9FUSO|nr:MULTISPECIES: YggT family protein [Psychrilyobacter]MCS5421417.1 YggT family protein [Psychrilyobacter sp. S5]NDI76601.1 YggT family protein [Psychrilyobacter piezotolerans]RDE65232.1 YggT family protein [Psychrilyobacter sp. S5]REI42850.1 YggT family protein [Psychrilyobacter piezotolerans]